MTQTTTTTKTNGAVIAPPINPDSELLKELARLKAENAALTKAAEAKTKAGIRITEKGQLHIPLAGSWGITCDRETALALVAAAPAIAEFVKANLDKIRVKPPKA